MKKLATKILFTLSLLVSLPSRALAQVTTVDDDVVTLAWLEVVFGRILAVSLQLIGIASFIMLLVGGFKYLTAGGDPKAAEQGKQTITYAIGGVVFAILAWFILLFISDFTGIERLLFFDTDID